VNEALAQQLAPWWEWIAVLDAALAAVMMTIGIAVGMVVAADWLARWRRTLERAGD
jgi:Mn2+/Fe2+ NRAMP family transporter